MIEFSHFGSKFDTAYEIFLVSRRMDKELSDVPLLKSISWHGIPI
jgi:hypothetical protein